MGRNKAADATSDADTDAALIGRLRDGCEDALIALYRRRCGDVYLFALGMGKSTSLADDVTQEVFLNVMENAAKFDAAKGSVRAWLLGCARHVVIDHLRRERRWTNTVPEEAVPVDAVELAQAGQQSERLHAAIARLPLAFRDVLVLCELQELSYAETAAVLQCPVGTVRSRLHRARACLARMLGEGGHGKAADTADASLAAGLNPGGVCP